MDTDTVTLPPRNGHHPPVAPAVRPAGLVRSALGTVAAQLDAFDRVLLAGLVMLGAGLWLWFELGVALTVLGGIVVALGLLAAARAGAPAADDTPAGRGG